MRRAAVVEFATIWVLCALAYFVVIPAQVSTRAAVGLRADVMPKAAVLTIAALSLLHLLVRLARTGEAEAPAPAAWSPVLLLVAAVALGVAAVAWIGLVAGSGALALLVTLALREYRPLRVVGHAAGAAAVASLIPLLRL